MLKEAILAAKQTAWSSALPQLKILLKTAELQALTYSRNLVQLPDQDVHSTQDMIATRRAELVSEAIISFHQTMFDAEATAEASAVIAYLKKNNICNMVPGSMANSGGTVVPLSGVAIATIAYYP